VSGLRVRRGRRLDDRAVRLEQDARRRSLRRELSQPPSARIGRLLRPGERAGHQVSTAHFQAAYPAVAEAGLGAQGVYIGIDLHGGSFVYDPWLLYQRGVLSIANTLVLGMPDFGKSSLTKSWLYRSRVFGRRCEIIDPKGEYTQLVHALGGTVLRLQPGGSTRLNPLTRLGSPEMREGLLQAVAHAMLGRPLAQVEAVGLVEALAAADESQSREVCVGHVVQQLRDPAQRTLDALDMTHGDAREQLREVALALLRLCHGPLHGMFDAPTSAANQAWEAPVVSLDISEIAAGSASSDLALAITMVCATAFLDAHRTQRTLRAQAAGCEAEKTIRVNDEAWRALAIRGLGEYYQAAFKLGRQTGVQHWLVLHRLSDLDTAGDAGTRQQALAKGLLAETGTVIVYRQHPDEARRATPILGLTQTESERIAHYPQGVAQWRIGGRSYEVRHIRSQREGQLTATDTAMALREPGHTPGAHHASGPGASA
jgi:type IV secretory pathway VirB4 component